MKKRSNKKSLPHTKKYRIVVKEVFKCYVEVDAADKDEALDIVEKQIANCDMVAPRDYDTFDRKVTVLRVVKSES